MLGNVVTLGMITVSTKAGGLDNIPFTDTGRTDVICGRVIYCENCESPGVTRTNDRVSPAFRT